MLLPFLLFLVLIRGGSSQLAQAQRGSCPGGVPSLSIECDPKRPWPRCPPQTYCYATNIVDIGPYFCCPSNSPGSTSTITMSVPSPANATYEAYNGRIPVSSDSRSSTTTWPSIFGLPTSSQPPVPPRDPVYSSLKLLTMSPLVPQNAEQSVSEDDLNRAIPSIDTSMNNRRHR